MPSPASAARFTPFALRRRRGAGGAGSPCYGTTHADYFYGAVPLPGSLRQRRSRKPTSATPASSSPRRSALRGIDPLAVPAVLVKSHGPFTWGKTPEKAVENALVLDECAHMALLTRLFDPSAAPAAQCIQDKHYFRKHGANAYYGQK